VSETKTLPPHEIRVSDFDGSPVERRVRLSHRGFVDYCQSLPPGVLHRIVSSKNGRAFMAELNEALQAVAAERKGGSHAK
jgi:hypothetical protein